MKLDQKAKNYAEALYNVSAKSESEITVMESLSVFVMLFDLMLNLDLFFSQKE